MKRGVIILFSIVLVITAIFFSESKKVVKLSDKLNNEIVKLAINTNGDNQLTLDELGKIGDLDLSHSEVDDISNLSYARNITQLYLDYTPIEEITELEKMPQLTLLNISTTNIRSFEALGKLVNLKTLYVNFLGIENFSELNIHDCQKIVIIGNCLNSLDGIETILGLEELDCTENKIVDIKAIENCKSLSTIILRRNPIVDWSSLVKCESLKTVVIDPSQYDILLKSNLISELDLEFIVN